MWSSGKLDFRLRGDSRRPRVEEWRNGIGGPGAANFGRSTQPPRSLTLGGRIQIMTVKGHVLLCLEVQLESNCPMGGDLS